MNQIHIEYLGKSTKAQLKWLPTAQDELQIIERTSSGNLFPLKLVNGINAEINPFCLTPESVIKADPEINLQHAGRLLDPESLSSAYFQPHDLCRHPVSDFQQIDIVYDAQGQEKERRPHLTRKANIMETFPVKVGKRIPLTQALTQFVFKQTYQIIHEDGVTMDFLFGIAKDLHEKEEIALLGAGPKGNLPLIIRDRGNPYRGFLYGEVAEGLYKLLILLSDQELKRAAAPPGSVQ